MVQQGTRYLSNNYDFHKTAQVTNSPDDWREFRNSRNVYNRAVKNAKTNYYNNKLTKKEKCPEQNVITIGDTNQSNLKDELKNKNTL